MQKRALGRSGLEVSPLMLGGNVFGWTADEPTSFRLLDRFVEAGGNFIDTADVYTRFISGHVGGESEAILGRWFRQSGKRDHVVLATKLGNDMGDGRRGLRPEYVRQAVDASLQRLQTDRIDLYQAHRDDLETPTADTLGAFAGLIAAGKVRAIGASNYSKDRLRAALELAATDGLPRFESLQPHYSLLAREEYERDLRPVVEEFGMGCVPYWPLASGFLTGKYQSREDAQGKARSFIVERYATDHGFAVLRVVEQIARELGASPAQVALAWVMAQPSITAPIASATSLDQLEELIRATSLTLPPAALDSLDQVSQASVPA